MNGIRDSFQKILAEVQYIAWAMSTTEEFVYVIVHGPIMVLLPPKKKQQQILDLMGIWGP